MQIAILLFMLTLQDTRTDSGLPIHKLTPGTILTSRRAIFCASGYAARVRSVSGKRKDSVFVRYHIPRESRKAYVIDHLIPLELGGSNRITNLFPQDSASARQKDRVEAWAKRQACTSGVNVRSLQRAISRDWRGLGSRVPPSFTEHTSAD